MTCGNPIKHKIQNLIDSWGDIFSVERKLTDIKWNVCNSGFVIILQDKLRKFPFFIINLNSF